MSSRVFEHIEEFIYSIHIAGRAGHTGEDFDFGGQLGAADAVGRV